MTQPARLNAVAPVIHLAPYRLKRDASVRLARLDLELSELRAEQYSLQVRLDLAPINSEEWGSCSLVDLESYALELEQDRGRLERVVEGVLK